MKKATIFVWTIGLLCLLASICIYPSLPDTIPIHWDLQGNVNGYGDPLSIFLFPILSLGIDIGMVVTRKIDPKREQYARSFGSASYAFRGREHGTTSTFLPIGSLCRHSSL